MKKGNIDLVKVLSDALEEELIRDIKQSLEGCSFRKDCLIERIKKLNTKSEDQHIIIDLAQWLETNNI